MKKILITGCSTGFGYNATKHFAQKGYQVYASMRNSTSKNVEKANELLDFAKSNGLNIEVLDIDVLSDESVDNAISKLPAIDVLINNAGAGFGGPIESFTSTQILDQLDINVVGTMRVAKAVLPKMRAQKSGLIIQLSSVVGRIAVPGFGVYNASKWALEGISEALRYELAPSGIDVVLVEPGPFETNFFKNMVPAKSEEIATAYAHVNEFMNGFGEQVTALYGDENAPTDPMLVVQAFDDLINLPNGSRPLRTPVGIDFGVTAINNDMEPHRKGSLEGMGLSDLDGPK